MEGDTIVALSTPPGESGIAVVRVSGPEPIDISTAWRPGAGRGASRKLFLRMLRDGAASRSTRRSSPSCALPRATRAKTWWKSRATGACRSSRTSSRKSCGAARGSPSPASSRSGRFSTERWTSRRRRPSPISSRQKRSSSARGARAARGERSRGRCARSRRRCSTSSPSSRCRSISPKRRCRCIPREKRARPREADARAIAALLESEIAGAKLRRGIRVTIVGAAQRRQEQPLQRAPRRGARDRLPRSRNDEGHSPREDPRRRLHVPPRGHGRDRRDALRDRGERDHDRREAAALAATSFCSSSTEARRYRDGDESRVSRASRRRSSSACSTRTTSGCGFAPARRARFSECDDVIAVSALSGKGSRICDAWIFDKGGQARRRRDLGRERIAVNARQAAALREADEALARLEDLDRRRRSRRGSERRSEGARTGSAR